MVRQDNVIICEGKLYLCFIDAEDVSQLRSLELLQQRKHARNDLLEQMGRGIHHLEDCLKGINIL